MTEGERQRTVTELHLRSTVLLRVAVLALVALACSLVVGSLADAAREHDGLTHVDGPTARWFASHRTPALDSLALHVGTVTAPAVVAVLCAVAVAILWFTHRRRPALLVAAAVGSAMVTSAVLKVAVARPRPLAPLNLTPETEPSFPSGHVLVLTTAVLMLVVVLWPMQSRLARTVTVAVGAAMVATVCADRLVIDAHWLTDVVASLALSVLIVCAVLACDLAFGDRVRTRSARVPVAV